jgi:type VI secretion system secreted protein VgrG
MHIPRIGQEVIVSFIEGDPDRPIITGRVYHGTNTPPYSLPDQKTKSTFKSKSSPDSDGVNEIRFEDKAGEEQLFIHAEKVLDHRSKGKSREFVGGSRHMIVAGDQYEKVGADKHLTVKGEHNEKVSGTISIHSVNGDILEKSAMNHAIDTGMDVHIKGGMKVIIEAGIQISLKAAGSFIDIGPGGIYISGPFAFINSGGAPGTGSGCSPEPPKEPQQADQASPVSISELSGAPPPEMEPIPQAVAFQEAAASGVPFCDQ